MDVIKTNATSSLESGINLKFRKYVQYDINTKDSYYQSFLHVKFVIPKRYKYLPFVLLCHSIHRFSEILKNVFIYSLIRSLRHFAGGKMIKFQI